MTDNQHGELISGNTSPMTREATPARAWSLIIDRSFQYISAQTYRAAG